MPVKRHKFYVYVLARPRLSNKSVISRIKTGCWLQKSSEKKATGYSRLQQQREPNKERAKMTFYGNQGWCWSKNRSLAPPEQQQYIRHRENEWELKYIVIEYWSALVQNWSTFRKKGWQSEVLMPLLDSALCFSAAKKQAKKASQPSWFKNKTMYVYPFPWMHSQFWMVLAYQIQLRSLTVSPKKRM